MDLYKKFGILEQIVSDNRQPAGECQAYGPNIMVTVGPMPSIDMPISLEEFYVLIDCIVRGRIDRSEAKVGELLRASL